MRETKSSLGAEAVEFGPFRLTPGQRRLERDGSAIALGSRAFDILLALVGRPQQTVTKRELMELVWPGVIVDEVSLRVHVSALRKALGDGQADERYIINLPGRGYCFVFPVVKAPLVSTAISRGPIAHRPPMPLTEIVGREDAIETIASQLIGRRFVSVVGSGGVGKTTVAIAVANTLSEGFPDGTCFVDLGTLADSQSVASAVASAIDAPAAQGDSTRVLLSMLARKHMLIVLDSCEHVVDAAAGLAETILQNCPAIHLLATSRESLRAQGECVYRLEPLECPPDIPGMTSAEMLRYPAVRLFVERLSTRGLSTEIDETDVPVIAGICRRLDGIALALELVAGRVDSFGVRGIAGLLDNQFALHLLGKRTSIPRHRTLSATIDWSYKLLAENEQRILRRLSVFTGLFSLEAAQAVVSDPESADFDDHYEAFSALIAKSLVTVVENGFSVRYRLLDTTRARLQYYLAESGDSETIAARHAHYYCDQIDSMQVGAMSLSSYDVDREELASNIRGALEFALSSKGGSVGRVRLAASATRVFREMSLLSECRDLAERAVCMIDKSAEPDRYVLELWTALALTRMFTEGNNDATHEAFTKAIEFAEALDDLRAQLDLFSGLFLFLTRSGEFQKALRCASSYRLIAERLNDSGSLALSTAMLGAAYHLAGDQVKAQTHCDASRGSGRIASSQEYILRRYGYDHHTRMLGALACIHWLRGRPSQALIAAREAIEHGRKVDHPVSFCLSLLFSSSVFFWVGDQDAARDAVAALQVHSERYSLTPYHAVACGLAGRLLAASGNRRAGISQMQEGLAELGRRRHQMRVITLAGDLVENLIAEGERGEALALINSVLKHDIDKGGSWYTPEIFRLKAMALGQDAYADAADCLLKSIDLAKSHASISWELRARTSLACLQKRRGRQFDVGPLKETYGHFSEGLGTPDLAAVRHLLSGV